MTHLGHGGLAHVDVERLRLADEGPAVRRLVDDHLGEGAARGRGGWVRERPRGRRLGGTSNPNPNADADANSNADANPTLTFCLISHTVLYRSLSSWGSSRTPCTEPLSAMI